MVTLPQGGLPLSQLETVKPWVSRGLYDKSWVYSGFQFHGQKIFSFKHVCTHNPASDMLHFFIFLFFSKAFISCKGA